MAIESKFRPFIEARAYVRKLGFTNWKEWDAFAFSKKRPSFIPSTPHRHYKAEWVSMRDWLGVVVAGEGKPFYSFAEARVLVRKLKLQNHKAFKEWVVSNSVGVKRFPKSPQKSYALKGWKGWADFLGNRHFGKRGRKFKSFYKARAVARSLGLRGWKEWRMWAASSKRPADIPARPAKIYGGKGWKSVADWLGYPERSAGARYVSKKR